MKQTLIVSNRGQLTLPTNLRKRFGIKDGGPIILEERDNELALKPAMVLEVEMYTDDQIAEWDKADRFGNGKGTVVPTVKKTEDRQIMRIFLDANVLFTAAHNPEGKAAFIIDMGKKGIFPSLQVTLLLRKQNATLR